LENILEIKKRSWVFFLIWTIYRSLKSNNFQKAYEIVHFIWHWTLGNWNEQYKNGEKPSGMSLKKEHFPFTYKVTKYAL
jgi:hypothetical protein